tara:strand:+ start:27583 stop:27780 length:198 start_codon:yes stop_codon:yes gene_type:complete
MLLLTTTAWSGRIGSAGEGCKGDDFASDMGVPFKALGEIEIQYGKYSRSRDTLAIRNPTYLCKYP